MAVSSRIDYERVKDVLDRRCYRRCFGECDFVKGMHFNTSTPCWLCKKNLAEAVELADALAEESVLSR